MNILIQSCFGDSLLWRNFPTTGYEVWGGSQPEVTEILSCEFRLTVFLLPFSLSSCFQVAAGQPGQKRVRECLSSEALGCSQRCARHLTAEGCSTARQRLQHRALLAGILTAFIFLGATFQVFCSWAVTTAWTGSDVLAILWAIHLKTPLTAFLAKISARHTVPHKKIGKWVVNPDKKLGRRKTYWTAGKTDTSSQLLVCTTN